MRTQYQVTFGERSFTVSNVTISGDCVSFTVLGDRYSVTLDALSLGEPAHGKPSSESARPVAARAALKEPAAISAIAGGVCAPISGVVVAIEVVPGAIVAAGQVLMVLEAMKMENPLRADRAGTVKEIRATKGAQVKTGEVVAVIE